MGEESISVSTLPGRVNSSCDNEINRRGLYYYGARYYEPTTSRWMSPDPAGFELINPMDKNGKPRSTYYLVESLNWYSYVNNNPVKYVDPTGMELIIKGDKDFVRETEKALDKIRSKPKGKELVGKLEDSEKRHVIKKTRGGNRTRARSRRKGYDGGSGSGSIIKYNPDKKTGGTDSTGSDRRDAFIGLAHELGHSEAMDEGIQNSDQGDGKPGTTPPSEVRSLKRENEVRGEHGLNERPTYHQGKR